MAKYTGKPIEAAYSADAAYEKLSNIEALQELLDNAPAEIKEKMGDVTFSNDEIVIGTPQIGNITLKVVERVKPTIIRYQAMDAPVPLSMALEITPEGDDKCKAGATIDVVIPAMLRPLVGPKLQEAADKFGDLLRLILNN